MQIVENWTCVTGIVLEVNARGDGSGAHAAVVLKIERIDEVRGFRSLLSFKVGDEVAITMPHAFEPGMNDLKGEKIVLPVRMARPKQFFADADWSLMHGSQKCGASGTVR
jgi:hypothetical protein